jgi:cytochrome c oxidase subunit 2
MNKFWSLLFLLVPILGCAVFIAAPYLNSWLPRDVSEHGRTIDHLFMFILWLTGAVFVATEGVLFYFMWKYNNNDNAEPVKFTHGSHGLEIVWTILPAATLLFIAIYQMDAWAASKMARRAPQIPPTVEVTGRQFEWRFRYPGPDGQLYTQDDIYHVNDLHLPAYEDVLVVIKSEDVLHSFFLPNLRVKQDLVPGMRQAVWFKATDVGKYDVVCAELCGWGHYKMKGQLTLQTRTDYEAWLDQMVQNQQAATVAEASE